MKWLLIFLLTLLPSSWALGVVTKSHTIETDLSETSAIKNIFLDEIMFNYLKETLGEKSDSPLFLKKLDLKFNLFFEELKKRRLLEKYGKNYSIELSEVQKNEFLKGIEEKKQQMLYDYMNLRSLYESYDFTKVEPDGSGPKKWTASLNFSPKMEMVQKLKEKILSDKQKEFAQLLVVSELNLINLTWMNLGLEKQEQFMAPIEDSWLQWLTQNQSPDVEEISLCRGSCLNDFIAWQKIRPENKMAIPESMLNTLWLKLSFNLTKISYVEKSHEWEIVWEGSLLLLDSNTKRVMFSSSMTPERRSFRMVDLKKLNSTLATLIYKSPLDGFSRMLKRIEPQKRLNRVSRLSISGYRNLADVLTLIEMLKDKVKGEPFEFKMDVMGKNETQIVCFFRGEEKTFTDLLLSIKEVKSSNSYKVVHDFSGIHASLKMVAD